MKFREKTPIRTKSVTQREDYHKYRSTLAQDFEHRCGYCGDRDVPRAQYFEIDHFVPKKLDGARVTDYSNLVYACRSCNNSKRDKWPTDDKNVANDGTIGWLDPCDPEYDKQFVRTNLGKITPVTDLGNWMYENLKLWKKHHEILWMYEQLESLSQAFESHYNAGHIKDPHKDMFIKILLAQKALLKRLY